MHGLYDAIVAAFCRVARTPLVIIAGCHVSCGVESYAVYTHQYQQLPRDNATGSYSLLTRLCHSCQSPKSKMREIDHLFPFLLSLSLFFFLLFFRFPFSLLSPKSKL